MASKKPLANIIMNVPHCPKCYNKAGAGTGYVEVVTKDGEKYLEWERYCSNPKCNVIMKYHTDIDLVWSYAFDSVGNTNYDVGEVINEFWDSNKE